MMGTITLKILKLLSLLTQHKSRTNVSQVLSYNDQKTKIPD